MADIRDKFKLKYSDYDVVDGKYNYRNIINLAYITQKKRYNESNFVIIDDSEYDLDDPSDVEGAINNSADELNDELPAIPEILSKPSTLNKTPNRDLKFTINSQLIRTPLSKLKITYNTEVKGISSSPLTQSMLFFEKNDIENEFNSSIIGSASTSSILIDMQKEKAAKKLKKEKSDKKSKKSNLFFTQSCILLRTSASICKCSYSNTFFSSSIKVLISLNSL